MKHEDVFPKDLADWTRYYLEKTLETGQIQVGEYVVRGNFEILLFVGQPCSA
ncbi:MAG: hypothetical protein RSE13_01820 [Planktothrix sp. GU0601_MAG3]|nr:MAG: hypothetical protein RSE13_01820 [Planktothrix sp. GU0601_MAG3]